MLIGPCGRTAAPIYDRTDNPNAVHAITPDTRVTVADYGKSQWMKFRVSVRLQPNILLLCFYKSLSN
ncbi:hypothetical protein MNV_920022 [Candidatus Methanoperedens nitroreducens]|uniref:Uncharacterized protein n=1 Tax=Candidatus Methanoperedens nitratireducens TaxID=1392998 RepID=A0A284VU84_9EURY|nr:hypothetical protein MNV_920022 [Candidatus Methanoperedens nitroreducens]